MELEKQEVLLEMPEQPGVERVVEAAGKAKLRTAHRDQIMFAQIYVEELIGADHKARAIWELTGRLDLWKFAEPLKWSGPKIETTS